MIQRVFGSRKRKEGVEEIDGVMYVLFCVCMNE